MKKADSFIFHMPLNFHKKLFKHLITILGAVDLNA